MVTINGINGLKVEGLNSFTVIFCQTLGLLMTSVGQNPHIIHNHSCHSVLKSLSNAVHDDGILFNHSRLYFLNIKIAVKKSL